MEEFFTTERTEKKKNVAVFFATLPRVQVPGSMLEECRGLCGEFRWRVDFAVVANES